MNGYGKHENEAWPDLPAPTLEQAKKAAQRLINSHFRNDDQAVMHIPVQPQDDDVLLMAYLNWASYTINTITADLNATLTALRESGWQDIPDQIDLGNRLCLCEYGDQIEISFTRNGEIWPWGHSSKWVETHPRTKWLRIPDIIPPTPQEGQE